MAWYDYDEVRKHQSDSYEIQSQYGEEGVLEHIFDNIGETTKFCVDIGAMDGILNSVTHHIRLYLENEGIKKRAQEEINNILKLADNKLNDLPIDKEKLLYFSKIIKKRGN